MRYISLLKCLKTSVLYFVYLVICGILLLLLPVESQSEEGSRRMQLNEDNNSHGLKLLVTFVLTERPSAAQITSWALSRDQNVTFLWSPENGRLESLTVSSMTFHMKRCGFTRTTSPREPRVAADKLSRLFFFFFKLFKLQQGRNLKSLDCLKLLPLLFFFFQFQ